MMQILVTQDKLSGFSKKEKKNYTLLKLFFKIPSEGTGYGHFEKATFWDLQLCTLGPGWFVHFKCPNNAPLQKDIDH